MKRLLAGVGAVVMIVAAIVIRSALDGNGSGSSTSSSGSGTIACITELAAQCGALTGGAVRIEDAAVTARAIASGKADIDAWVTLDPWPTIVNQLAQRDATGTSTRVARTELVIAMVQERASKLAAACNGAVNWKCLGDDIGRPWAELGGLPDWGTVKAGVPKLSSAEGVLLLGHAASGFFGTSNFATNDFNDAFLVWKSKVTTTPATFGTFIQLFPAAFSAVGTTGVDARTGSGAHAVAVIDPVPPAREVVVIAPLKGHRVPGFTSGLKDRLRDAGWSVDGLDASTGLPDAGVLLALSGLTG